jgi:hypothetical protein
LTHFNFHPGRSPTSVPGSNVSSRHGTTSRGTVTEVPARSGTPRQPGRGRLSPWITRTGQTACSGHAELTDPGSGPAKPPCPRLPATSIRASSRPRRGAPWPEPPSLAVRTSPSGPVTTQCSLHRRDQDLLSDVDRVEIAREDRPAVAGPALSWEQLPGRDHLPGASELAGDEPPAPQCVPGLVGPRSARTAGSCSVRLGRSAGRRRDVRP